MPATEEVQIVLVMLACVLLAFGFVVLLLKREKASSLDVEAWISLNEEGTRFMHECHREVDDLLSSIIKIERYWLDRGREVPEEDAARIKEREDLVLAAQFAYHATRELIEREHAALFLRRQIDDACAA